MSLLILGFVYRINIFLISRLPEKYALIPDWFYMRCLAGPMYRKGRLRNIRLVYGDRLNEKQIRKLADAYIRFRVKLNANATRSVTIPYGLFAERNKLYGSEHLDAALKQGRGVLLVSAHIGDFYSANAVIAFKGYDMAVAGVPVVPKSLEQMSRRLAQRANLKRILVGQGAARTALQLFRRNGVFSVLFDIVQSDRLEESIRLPFGNATMAFHDGPARLATRFNVVVVPYVSYIREPFHTETYIEPAFPEIQGRDDTEKAQLMMVQWRDWLEPKIMATPEQWWSWPFARLFEKERSSSGANPGPDARQTALSRDVAGLSSLE